MQTNVTDFINEYEQWTGQEKYKDFDYISKSLTPTWKNRLLQNKKLNIWAIVFGPIYLMSLGGAFSGFFGLLAEIFIGCLIYTFTGTTIVAILFVLAFNSLIGLQANKLYMKQKLAFKKKMQDFDPTAPVEWFNISAARLIILTLLTGGLYLVYWFYRQSKAIRDCQKDKTFTPIVDGLFCYLCSIHIFKRIARSLGKPKGYSPKRSAWAFFLMPGLIALIGTYITINFIPSVNSQMSEEEQLKFILDTMRTTVRMETIITWLTLYISAMIVNKWRFALGVYCKNNQILSNKKTTIGEIIIIILGLILNWKTLYATYLYFFL